MRIIDPSYEFVTPMDKESGMTILKRIELIGRTCYKSEDKITDDSAVKFVKMLIDRDHTAMIEHCSFSVRFIASRGFHNEMVRHRIASYAAESTRYCLYSKEQFGNELTVIKPIFFKEGSEEWEIWYKACEQAEMAYKRLTIDLKRQAQEARSVLPLSTKNDCVMTANLRSWRNFFKLRSSPTAHPEMQQLVVPLLKECKELIPVIFDDL